jgi:cytochrome c-type biogenesis protein CcmH
MAESLEKQSNGMNNASRWALIGAAAIAIGAGGYAVYKRSSGPETAQTAPATQAEIGSSIASLEAKLKDNPNDAEGWRMLGWSLFETGKFAESAGAYKRATQLDPKKAEYFSSLGEALVLAGKGDVPPDAKAAFDTAIGLDAKDPRARYFLAVAKDIAGDHKGAIDDWFALLSDTPSGAPWEGDVRRIITEVAAKEKIEVASRMAKLPALAAPTGGAAVATAAIPGPTPQQMRDAAGMPKGQQDMMVAGMVDSLEKKLKTNPDNPDGWIMLMRSRMSLGETAKASTALKSARTALGADQQKLGMVNAAAAELGVPGG